MAKWAGTAARWLAVAFLWLTASVAGHGLTLACHVRNQLLWASSPVRTDELSSTDHPRVSDIMREDSTRYFVDFGLMILWFAAVTAFYFWTRRERLGIAMTVIPISAFGVFALQTWHYAWPVCNAF